VVQDRELFGRWCDGDLRAGNALFDRYFPAIRRFFRNKLDADVEDLVQRTFVACVEARDRFRGDASFRTYLFALAHNVLRRHYRTASRKGEALDFDEISAVDLGAGPSTILNMREELVALLDGLRAIPLASQVILELVYWEKMTGPELAVVLDVPVDTARTRLRRARQLLASAIAKTPHAAGKLGDSLDDLEQWAGDLHEYYEKAIA
jgi:RNA polymerase sigma factor (sigma-70 family)